MKRAVLVLLAACIMLGSFPSALAAKEEARQETEFVTYLDDGSYFVTSIREEALRASSTLKRGTKVKKLYNSDDELQWLVTLTAVFSYDGTTSTCTSATCSTTIYENCWGTSSCTSSHSGNTAYGYATFACRISGIIIDTRNVTVKLTCDENGVLS